MIHSDGMCIYTQFCIRYKKHLSYNIILYTVPEAGSSLETRAITVHECKDLIFLIKTQTICQASHVYICIMLHSC